jgi:alpha-beta hydrolase superfamily lysophospholipase
VTSIFDRDAFNESLFFPRTDASEPPPAAVDRFVALDDAQVHVRCHAVPDARCTLLLFHGNGEVAADYDHTADRFAALGAALAVAEFRGYGQATGVPTLRAVVADARPLAEAVPGAPLIVMGRSLGGVAAHELFARPIGRMAGVILESAFYDLGNEALRNAGMAVEKPVLSAGYTRGRVPRPAYQKLSTSTRCARGRTR